MTDDPTPQLNDQLNDQLINYGANTFIPRQKEKDWFETIEPVDAKNLYLNIYRPISIVSNNDKQLCVINEIKNHDTVDRPKFTLAPWNQSPWEPDRSLKSLCC